LKRSANHLGRRDGQAVLLVVLSMSVLLIGVLGFAIDGGQMYAQQQMAQAAADAAAQAGIMSILDGTNATSTFTFGTGSTPIGSYTCTTTDGRTPCVYSRNNGFGGTSSDTVTLSYPASVSGVTLSSVTVPAFQVTVQRTLHTGLIRFIGGPATTTISAKAISGIMGVVSPNSVFILDSAKKDALNISGAAVLNVSGGGVAVDSNNAEAAVLSGSGQVNASLFTSVGGVSITGGASSNPVPSTGKASVADPFASLPAPTVGSCATHPTLTTPPNGASTLLPGTYCGGISIGNIANVTFSPGTYIINGGGISFGNSGVATGSGVMFYLTGTNSTYGSLTANGASSITLSAPTSGTYEGILFYQDRTITSSVGASFGGSAAFALTGSLYFPTTSVTFSGAVNTASYMAIIADSLTLTGSASILYDSTGQKTGLTTAKGVALMQ